MDHRPKCRAKTLKLLEENVRTSFHDLGISNGLLDMTLKAQAKKDNNK